MPTAAITLATPGSNASAEATGTSRAAILEGC
jgi:hypothetical protein